MKSKYTARTVHSHIYIYLPLGLKLYSQGCVKHWLNTIYSLLSQSYSSELEVFPLWTPNDWD
jgi:hypothetical protein